MRVSLDETPPNRKKKVKNMNKLQIFVIMLLVISTAGIASASTEPITIDLLRINTNQTNFIIGVTVSENIENITNVQAHVSLYTTWNLLDEGDSIGEYSGIIDISAIPNGNYEIKARYLTSNGTRYYSSSIPLVINRPSPTTPTPTPTPQPTTFDLFIKDTSGKGLMGVISSYRGLESDNEGLIRFTDLILNNSYQSWLNKTGYYDQYISFIPTPNSPTKTIIMKRPTDNLKRFSVQGFQSIVESPSMLYLRVKDDATGDAVDGAVVYTFKGNIVQNIPGNTTNGGRITVSFSEAGFFEVVISKTDYEEWSETITVIAPKPTPTPTLAPAPPRPYQCSDGEWVTNPSLCPKTDPKIYRPDAGFPLSDDEYREKLTAGQIKISVTTIIDSIKTKISNIDSKISQILERFNNQPHTAKKQTRLEEIMERVNNSPPRNYLTDDISDLLEHQIEKAPPKHANLTTSSNGFTIQGKNATRVFAQGNSMIPTMRNGQEVIMELDFDTAELGIGDIVAYSRPDRDFYTMHRIVWRNDTHFITKGDNIPINGTIQPIQRIVGYVIGIVY